MQSDLHIRFNDGEMMVHLDTFLPCSKGQLKRLMRLVMRDWEHADERLGELQEYLKRRLEEYRYLMGLAERGAKGADTQRVVRLRNEVLRFEELLECAKEYVVRQTA